MVLMPLFRKKNNKKESDEANDNIWLSSPKKKTARPTNRHRLDKTETETDAVENSSSDGSVLINGVDRAWMPSGRQVEAEPSAV